MSETSGQWVCRVCAAKAVHELGTHNGDAAQKRPDPGPCAICQFPGVLFWIEPIAAETAEVAPSCGGCLYYQAYNENEGHCTRYPPTVFYNGVTFKVEYVIPQVWAICSCGEFKPKAKP